jgi:EpsI family protein
MMSSRFWVVAVFIVSTIVLVQVRGDVDHVPPSTPLENFPIALGPWTGTSFPLDQETLDVLGKGVFMSRSYQPDPSSADPGSANIPDAKTVFAEPVSLFIGYFPTQRSGQSIHSPQNCMPGAGWVFNSSGETQIGEHNGKPINVGEYVISNGDSKAEVLYWYQTQGHSIASDYKAKLYMLADSIRYGRTDAALVRIITPLTKNETQQQAHLRAVTFARQVTPLLSAYIPD